MSKKSVVTNSTKSLSSNVSVISDDALNSYIKRISKIPVLSQQEEISLAKEMAALIYKQTKDVKFTRNMLLFIDNSYKRRQMIQYIRDNNPTLLEINHKSAEIVL